MLITRGIYRWLRHPSYVGFFYWSIGMQLILNNYLSAALSAAASCAFFRRRIPYEEGSLLSLFPDDYPAYARRTYIGIPFVSTTSLYARYEKEEISESRKER